jgi:hypothetical protein
LLAIFVTLLKNYDGIASDISNIASDIFIKYIAYIDSMQRAKEDTPFIHKAAAAMIISVIADALDYFAAPLFDVPVIGDVFDVITTSILYSITKSKISTAINTIELIPVIGDFVPTYTLSTLLWISRELKKRNKIKRVAEYKNYKVIDS